MHTKRISNTEPEQSTVMITLDHVIIIPMVPALSHVIIMILKAFFRLIVIQGMVSITLTTTHICTEKADDRVTF